jgi:hypothetical protein
MGRGDAYWECGGSARVCASIDVDGPSLGEIVGEAACSAAALWSLSMSSSSSIQYSTGEGVRGMYSGDATQVEVMVCVSEGGRGMEEASGEVIKVGEGLRVGARGMRQGPMVVVAYIFCM